MRNFTTRSIGSTAKHALLPIALALAAAGCSQVVDTPPTTPPEANVANYYLHLGTTNAEYDYTVTSNAPYHPASGELVMSMQGTTDSFGGMPVYACLWSYANFGAPQLWYYCLADTEAAGMGLETTPDDYTDSWVDLKADSTKPLEQGATWSFVSQGEQITATVKQYGATAQVEGKTYSNVIMVQYAGVKGTTATEWFAKGIGPIFSHVERPNFGMVENHLLSIKQP